jgi:hypothetical protein
MRSAVLAIALAWIGLVGASVADGALAKLDGGSGLSGTLSSNRALRRQQLICDPNEPLDGSTSVDYDPTKVTLTGYAMGPSYFLSSGYVEVSTGPEQRVLQNIAQFLTQPAGVETGYMQLIYYQYIGTAGQISPAGPDGNYVLRDDNPGVTGVGAVDTHAIYFDLLGSLPLTTVAKYRVYASPANMHSGNTADYFTAAGPNGTRGQVAAADIQEVSVSGDFVPEPSTLAAGGAFAAGLLLRRRRRDTRVA